MNDKQFDLMIRKKRKLRELDRAKDRVKRLERELRGEPVQPEDAFFVPDFLRPDAGSGHAVSRTAQYPEP